MSRAVEMVLCPACGAMGIRRGLMGGACVACGKTARDRSIEDSQQDLERLGRVLQPGSAALVRDIEWMCARGSSLVMNWGEDTGCWEVAWITRGKRYCGNSDTLDDALYCARIAARDGREDLEGG